MSPTNTTALLAQSEIGLLYTPEQTLDIKVDYMLWGEVYYYNGERGTLHVIFYREEEINNEEEEVVPILVPYCEGSQKLAIRYTSYIIIGSCNGSFIPQGYIEVKEPSNMRK